MNLSSQQGPPDAAGDRLPVAEFVEKPGVIDLAWGHPDPDLLPVEKLAELARTTLRRFGPEALAYGAPAGPGPLIEAVVDRLERTDSRPPRPDEICLTGGVSAALEQSAKLLADPGQVILVEAPTYHFALRILASHPLEICPLPFDAGGLVVEALPESLARIRASGRKVGFLYTIPTFHNPTGLTLTPERRRALLELAEAEDLLLVEDDVYRELSFDGPAPPSLWSLAPPGRVVRLGSFAKSLAPGLRVGYLTADRALAERFSGQPWLQSGGAPSHLPSLLVATCMAEGLYPTNVRRLQAAYRQRREALLEALRTAMPQGTTWTRPAGGYFTWVTLPAGDTRELLPAVKKAGSGYIPGTTFLPSQRPEDCGPLAEQASRSFRLAWSRYSPEALRESVRRMGEALRG